MDDIKDVKAYTVSGEFDIAGSFKSDKESEESKRVTLRFVMDRVPLIDIITPALSTKKITWVNGPGRTNYDKWANHSLIRVNYTSPASKVETREDRVAKFVAMGFEPKLAEFAVDNPEKFAGAVNETLGEKAEQ